MKLTRDQVESRKKKAVRFTENVLEDSDRADEIEQESVEDYAERRGIQIIENPRQTRRPMARTATKTKAQLEEQIEELQDEVETLNSQLDEIAGIVAPDDEEEDEDGDVDEEDDDR